jgi:hypothetical protein
MSDQINPFAGTWSLDTSRSQFDANHQPRSGRMHIAVDSEGCVVMRAEGVNEQGEPCVERPTRLNPDGRDYPVPDFAGLVVKALRPDPRTLRTECRRADGSIVGAGTFVVSEDGRTLHATTSGWDTQLREFSQTTVWERNG